MHNRKYRRRKMCESESERKKIIKSNEIKIVVCAFFSFRMGQLMKKMKLKLNFSCRKSFNCRPCLISCHALFVVSISPFFPSFSSSFCVSFSTPQQSPNHPPAPHFLCQTFIIWSTWNRRRVRRSALDTAKSKIKQIKFRTHTHTACSQSSDCLPRAHIFSSKCFALRFAWPNGKLVRRILVSIAWKLFFHLFHHLRFRCTQTQSQCGCEFFLYTFRSRVWFVFFSFFLRMNRFEPVSLGKLHALSFQLCFYSNFVCAHISDSRAVCDRGRTFERLQAQINDVQVLFSGWINTALPPLLETSG